MRTRRNRAIRLLALFISLQVINISMNVSDQVVGKSTLGYIYVNEIETVVELVMEVCLQKKDAIPENQMPGGTLSFEEEEKIQLTKTNTGNNPPAYFIAGFLYKKGAFQETLLLEDPNAEVTTPPPKA